MAEACPRAASTSRSGTATLCVPTDHPCLPGHFPGHPVVPGVLLLDALAAALAQALPPARLARLLGVKFAAPVLPGQRVVLTWAETAPDRIAFSGMADGAPVLTGRAELAAFPGLGAGGGVG